MRFLLDQGLPRSAAALLRERGFQAEHVEEIALSTGTDAAILERGRQDASIVVTLDADFHALLAHSGSRFPSVVRIRDEGLRAEDLLLVVCLLVEQCGDVIEQGAVVSVKGGNVRLRRLPLKEDQT